MGENEGVRAISKDLPGVKLEVSLLSDVGTEDGVPRFFFLVCPFAARHSVEELSWVKRLS